MKSKKEINVAFSEQKCLGWWRRTEAERSNASTTAHIYTVVLEIKFSFSYKELHERIVNWLLYQY